jgi:heparan-alpha-glucosaminide N-acetyltransferase
VAGEAVKVQATIQSLPATQPERAPTSQAPARNIAVDTYRGFVMLLMMAEIVQLSRVAQALPGNWFWNFVAYHQTHVEWAGCSLHDTIQPGFSFLVGVALPYSIASRLARGGTFGRMFGHALWRSLLLVALGIFLRSMHSSQTYFTFEDTLTQIGLGYPLLFLLGFRPARWQWAALGAILFGYWLAWAVYSYPDPAAGTGFFAHWAKNSNLGHAFDLWFLNLFPTSQPFVGNRGGYLTLSFIPTLGTMILGLAAGRWLRDSAPAIPMRRLLAAGGIGIAAGLLLHFAGICPIVKRIWTPGWTLFSGGLCFLFLAGFCWLIEVKGYRKWAFPLVVIGMNSMAAYLMAHLFERFILDSLRIHLGAHAFAFLGTAFEPLMRGIAVLLVYWLMLWWMYRRKLFLRI